MQVDPSSCDAFKSQSQKLGLGDPMRIYEACRSSRPNFFLDFLSFYSPANVEEMLK